MKELAWVLFAFLLMFGQPVQAELNPTRPTVEAEYARVLSVCWDAPTAYLNGVPLNPETDILQYEVEIQQPSGVSVSSAGKALTYEHTLVNNGQHCFKVRAQATNQLFSPWTEQICKDIHSAPIRMQMRFCNDSR